MNRTEKFTSVCNGIFGFGWQSQTARELKVNVRTIQRWASGDVLVNESVFTELLVIAERRNVEISEVLTLLKEATR